MGDGFFSHGPLTDTWLGASTAGAWHNADVIVFTSYGPLGLRRAKQQSWAGAFTSLGASLRYLGPTYWIPNSTLTPLAEPLLHAIRRGNQPLIPPRTIATTATLQLINPDTTPLTVHISQGR